mmetsp:Transcript_31883/g.92167  ORF Transcript_31883/g.92167 Transcript_31883/m.92167 type:complete len:266 (-) Transcript_31883:945-1742(-)
MGLRLLCLLRQVAPKREVCTVPRGDPVLDHVLSSDSRESRHVAEMLAAASARRRLGHDLPVLRRRQHPTRQQRKRPRPDQALGLHHPGCAAGRAGGPGAHQHQQPGLRRQHAGRAAEHGPENAGKQADLMGRGLREVLQGESGAARLGSGEEVAGGDGGLAQRRLDVQRGGLAHRAEQRTQPRGRPERPGGGARLNLFLCLLVRPFTGSSRRRRRRRRRRRSRLVWAGPRLEKHFRGAHLSLRLCLLVRPLTRSSRRRRRRRRPV